MKCAAAAIEYLLSSFCTQPLYMCTYCSTVEECVCVCVRGEQVFFFVCLSDGAMMVTHRRLLCVYESAREDEKERLLQPIMNHNKDMAFNGNTDGRWTEYWRIHTKLKPPSLDKPSEVYTIILDVTETTLNTCKLCLIWNKKSKWMSQWLGLRYGWTLAVLLTLWFACLPAPRPVFTRATSSRDKDVQFTVSLQAGAVFLTPKLCNSNRQRFLVCSRIKAEHILQSPREERPGQLAAQGSL